jgi:hypothetical protein
LLFEQPKSMTKQNDDGEKQSVGDHLIPLDASRNLDMVSPETLCVSGTGGKPLSN